MFPFDSSDQMLYASKLVLGEPIDGRLSAFSGAKIKCRFYLFLQHRSHPSCPLKGVDLLSLDKKGGSIPFPPYTAMYLRLQTYPEFNILLDWIWIVWLYSWLYLLCASFLRLGAMNYLIGYIGMNPWLGLQYVIMIKIIWTKFYIISTMVGFIPIQWRWFFQFWFLTSFFQSL